MINYEFSAEKEAKKVIGFIKEQLEASGGDHIVIGISGGKDSSTVAALSVLAVGRENVTGVLMPSGNQHDINCSYRLVNHLGIEYKEINIGETVKAETEALEKAMGMPLEGQARINLPPRIRMSVLYAVSQMLGKARVINTSNLSEDWVGYATIYGDSVGFCSPLGQYTTEEVIAMGEWAGLPEVLTKKTPIDGLCGKTDEENLGFSYETVNRYIREGICEDPTVKEKIDRLNKVSRFKFVTIPMCPAELPVKADDILKLYR